MLRGGLSILITGALLCAPLGGDARVPTEATLDRATLSVAGVEDVRAAEEAGQLTATRVPAPQPDRGLVRPVLYPLHLRPLPGEAPRHIPRGGRELVLTFDDGPDLKGTPGVLAELDRRGLKAIFFVNGQHMVGSRPEDFARRDLLRSIASHGHLVANHTLSHRNVCAEPDRMEAEIDGNAEIIAAATGVRPLLFRSPYGARCRGLDQALRERDLLQVGWNVDPQEWRGGSEEAVVAYVTEKLAHFGGRAILLLHDTQRETAHALPRILDWIAAENERVAGTGREPIRIRDYSVFLPATPLPETGFEAFWPDIEDILQNVRVLALGAPLADSHAPLGLR